MDFEKIKIFDDFFSKEVHSEIWEYLHPTRPVWSMTGGSHMPNCVKFWHIDGLERDEYFSNFIFKKIIIWYRVSQAIWTGGIPRQALKTERFCNWRVKRYAPFFY